MNHKFQWPLEDLNPLGHKALYVEQIWRTQISCLTTGAVGLCWVTSTSSQIRKCDSVVLKILMDHNFQQLQEDLNCEYLTCNSVNQPSKLGQFGVPESTTLWPYEHDSIAVSILAQSGSYSIQISYSCRRVANLDTANPPKLISVLV